MALILFFLMVWSHWSQGKEHIVSNTQMNRNILFGTDHRWPGGVVPYKIDPNATSIKSLIKSSMDYIEKQTCVRFVEKTNETSYLYIIGSLKGECYSYAGYFPDRYTLMSLNTTTCNKQFFVKHELLHALGFKHEHTRPDRDTYLRINWGNIDENEYPQFYRYVEKKSDIRDCDTQNKSINESLCTREDIVTTYGLPYDYGSIMHYSETTFSKDRKSKTMVPIQHVPEGIKIGATNDLSYWDILKIRKAYNCSMCLTLHKKKPCKFPFKYWGKTYHVCTDVASIAPWCATEVNEESQYIEYDYCEPSCIECGTSNHPSKSCNQTSVGTKGTAELGDYPWHAFIMVWTEVQVKCEGAMLTKNHVLSAASCIKEYENKTLVVKIGSVNTIIFDSRFNIYEVTSKTYHPGYKASTHENDLVILNMKYGIYLNQYSIPVSLPQASTNNYTDMPATYTGVDILSNTGKNKLGFLVTKIGNDSECHNSDNTICASAYGTPSNGNWGSPLVAKVNGSCTLIGIHSIQSEGESVLKFTRIDRYLEWIKPNILYYFNVYKDHGIWEYLNIDISGFQ